LRRRRWSWKLSFLWSRYRNSKRKKLTNEMETEILRNWREKDWRRRYDPKSWSTI